MTLYENVFIVRQDVSAQQVEDLTTRFTGLIADGGGTVMKNEYWGLRTLAYKIKKNRKGHYVLLNIDAPSDAVKEMERNMNLNEDVMRFMTIRVDEVDEGPSVMMRSRAAREERERDRTRGRSERPRERPRKEVTEEKPASKDDESKTAGAAVAKDAEKTEVKAEAADAAVAKDAEKTEVKAEAADAAVAKDAEKTEVKAEAADTAPDAAKQSGSAEPAKPAKGDDK